MNSRQPQHYIGTATIASWFGIEPRTVTKWLSRYDDFPTPDVTIEERTPGWLPQREHEIRAWEKSRRGQDWRKSASK